MEALLVLALESARMPLPSVMQSEATQPAGRTGATE
jgi:hypothetical protein